MIETRRRIAAMDGVRMVLDAVSWVHVRYPRVLEDLLDEHPSKAREIIQCWLNENGCTINKGRGRTAGRIVTPPAAADQWRIAVTLSNVRKLFDFWKEVGIRDGHNPMQMDADRSRLGGAGPRATRSPSKWRMDVDSFYRVRQIGNQAPCPDDDLASVRVLEAGRKAGWPEEVQLLYEGQYLTGARRGQLSVATAYGLLVGAKSPNHLALPQKGSNGDLEWHARTPAAWREKIMRMLSKRLPGGMVELERLAKSRKAEDVRRLRELYIFSPDGKAPMPGWRLDHCLRQVVERLKLKFEIVRDDGTLTVRWFTSHWFRHHFVGRMLDSIAESALDAAGREGAQAKLGRYMGWKNPELMLAYYGRRHFEREVDELVSVFQDELNQTVDLMLGDDDEVPCFANDNVAWSTGRVVGDLLA